MYQVGFIHLAVGHLGCVHPVSLILIKILSNYANQDSQRNRCYLVRKAVQCNDDELEFQS